MKGKKIKSPKTLKLLKYINLHKCENCGNPAQVLCNTKFYCLKCSFKIRKNIGNKKRRGKYIRLRNQLKKLEKRNAS